MFCRTCGKPVLEQALACPACGCAPRAPGPFCFNCAAPVQPQALVCPACHANLVAPSPVVPGLPPSPYKSRNLAGLLNVIAIVGIPGGIGRLYLGYIGIGVAQLLLSFLCVGQIWSLIDGILILTGSLATDAEGQPLTN